MSSAAAHHESWTMPKIRSRMVLITSMAGVIALSPGCGGGTRGSTPPATPAAGPRAPIARTHATLKIHLRDRPSASASQRRKNYVSKGTNGLQIAITPHGQVMTADTAIMTNADVGPASVLCQANPINGDGGRDCSIYVAAPVGAVDVYAAAFDKAPADTNAATGYGTHFDADVNYLSAALIADGSQQIAAAGTTILRITLSGVVALGGITVDDQAGLPFIDSCCTPGVPVRAIPLIVIPNGNNETSVNVKAHDSSGAVITAPGDYMSFYTFDHPSSSESGGPQGFQIYYPTDFPATADGSIAYKFTQTADTGAPSTSAKQIAADGQPVVALTRMSASVPALNPKTPATITVAALGARAFVVNDVASSPCTNVVSYTMPAAGFPATNGTGSIPVVPLNSGSCQVAITQRVVTYANRSLANPPLSDNTRIVVTLTVDGSSVQFPIHIPGGSTASPTPAASSTPTASPTPPVPGPTSAPPTPVATPTPSPSPSPAHGELTLNCAAVASGGVPSTCLVHESNYDGFIWISYSGDASCSGQTGATVVAGDATFKVYGGVPPNARTGNCTVRVRDNGNQQASAQIVFMH